MSNDQLLKMIQQAMGAALGAHFGSGGGTIGGILGGLAGLNAASGASGGGGGPRGPALLNEAAQAMKDAAHALQAVVAKMTPQGPQGLQGPLMGQVGKSAVNPATGLPFLNMGVVPPAGAAGAAGGLAAAAGPIGLAITAALALKGVIDKTFEGFHKLVDIVPNLVKGFTEMLPLPHSIAALVGSMASLMAAPVHMWVEAIHLAITPIELLQDPLKLVKIGFQAIAETGRALVRVLVDLRDPAAMLKQVVAPFITQMQHFNPGAVDRMNLAFDNLSAAAGRIFEPIIEAARGFADELNVLYTAIGPELKALIGEIVVPFRDALRGLAVGVFDMVREAIPTIRALVDGLSPAVRFVGIFARGLTQAVSWLVRLGEVVGSTLISPILGVALRFTSLRDVTARLIATFMTLAEVVRSTAIVMSPLAGVANTLAGGAGPNFNVVQIFRDALRSLTTPGQPLTGRKTVAAIPARQIGIEELGQQARAAAFSLGLNGPAEQTANNTAQATTVITLIWRLLQQQIGNIQGAMNPPEAQVN